MEIECFIEQGTEITYSLLKHMLNCGLIKECIPDIMNEIYEHESHPPHAYHTDKVSDTVAFESVFMENLNTHLTEAAKRVYDLTNQIPNRGDVLAFGGDFCATVLYRVFSDETIIIVFGGVAWGRQQDVSYLHRGVF